MAFTYLICNTPGEKVIDSINYMLLEFETTIWKNIEIIPGFPKLCNVIMSSQIFPNSLDCMHVRSFHQVSKNVKEDMHDDLSLPVLGFS